MISPLIIVAGIPLGTHQRARIRPTRPGWTIKVIPSHDHGRADLSGIWSRVLEEADRAPDAGVHLFLAHDRESDRPSFRELSSRCHRAIWLPRELSRRYGQKEFLQAFDELINFEEEWRAKIRPEIGSPLLLPETAFFAEPSVSDAWSRARNVNRAQDNLNAVEKTIKRFSSRHRRRGFWYDCQELIFCHGPHHGGHGLPNWRHRKFTYCFPNGFHFDVRHSRSNNFHIHSRSEVRTFAVYTNVDPHGFVRGGR